MANIKKPDGKRLDKTLPLRMTPGLHARLIKQQTETGISISERARKCLEQQLIEWEQSRESE